MIDQTNPAAKAQSKSQAELVTGIEQLESGQSIDSASNNPTGLDKSTSYNVELSSIAKSMNYIQEGLSLLDVAGGAVNAINQNVQSINSLIAQAGDGVLTSEDRDAIQSQINQLNKNIDKLAGSAQFNGYELLDGSINNIKLQTGPNAGETSTISIGNFSSAALGLAGIDVATKAGQKAAFSSVENAFRKINNQSAIIGSTKNSISSTLSKLGLSYKNLAASQSQTSDIDYSAASASIGQASAINQANLKGIALYNSIQGTS